MYTEVTEKNVLITKALCVYLYVVCMLQSHCTALFVVLISQPVVVYCYFLIVCCLQSLGQLSGPPTVQNGSYVSLSYTNGGNCSNTAKYSATVNIRCSQEEVGAYVPLDP